MKKGIIYKAINKINNKVYIGQTTQEFSKRKSQHKYLANKNNNYFCNAIRKYGFDNFKWEIIFEGTIPIEELNEKEPIKHTFYHKDGRIEKDITQKEMILKHKTKHISDVVLGKRNHSNGWFLKN